MDNIKETINKINTIEECSYFKILKKFPTKKSFVNSLSDFIIAVNEWSKILGLMIYKVPSDKERSVIINNLMDEHGNGDISKSHVNTFQLFINSLDNDSDRCKEILKNYNSYNHINQEVEQFVKQIIKILIIEDWIVTISMLGMIEYTYITVSKNIHNYAKNFIKLHEIADFKHSFDFFELVAPYYETDKSNINTGINLGYTIIYEYFGSISKYLELKTDLEPL